MGIEAESKYVEQQMAEITRQEKLAQARIMFENGSLSAEEFAEITDKEPVYTMPSNKEILGVNGTKAMFINSIYNWLIATLKKVGNGDYTGIFKVEGSSIICELPDNYFSHYAIPHGTKIEMKFITKKG